MMIYVVEGTTGEYSDHREWLTRAYRSEDAAKAEVVRLTEAALTLEALMREHNVNRWDGKKYDALVHIADLNDPGYQSDYTGTQYVYLAVELVDA